MSVADDLAKLSQLRDAGALSDAEFEAAKTHLLDSVTGGASAAGVTALASPSEPAVPMREITVCASCGGRLRTVNKSTGGAAGCIVILLGVIACFTCAGMIFGVPAIFIGFFMMLFASRRMTVCSQCGASPPVPRTIQVRANDPILVEPPGLAGELGAFVGAYYRKWWALPMQWRVGSAVVAAIVIGALYALAAFGWGRYGG